MILNVEPVKGALQVTLGCRLTELPAALRAAALLVDTRDGDWDKRKEYELGADTLYDIQREWRVPLK